MVTCTCAQISKLLQVGDWGKLKDLDENESLERSSQSSSIPFSILKKKGQGSMTANWFLCQSFYCFRDLTRHAKGCDGNVLRPLNVATAAVSFQAFS